MLVVDFVRVRIVAERSSGGGNHYVPEDDLEGPGDIVVRGLGVRLLLPLAQSAEVTGEMRAGNVDTVAVHLLQTVLRTILLPDVARLDQKCLYIV